MEILLLRHAQTAGNLQKRYIGSTDEPLCAEGEERAKQTAALLGDFRPDRVIVTPLLRTGQTAALLFPGVPVEISEDMREMCFGRFENKNYLELADDPDYAAWLETGCEAACPEGEGMEDFCARCRTGFERVIARCAARGEERVAMVLHGGSLMAILSGYAQPARSYFEWSAPNCGGYLCRLVPREFNRDRIMRLEGEAGWKY